MKFFRFLRAIKWSVVGFAVAFVLNFLSMGAVGALLYYPTYPVLAPFYGDLNQWRGDWVWSGIIGAGLLWSFSFLAAGWVNLKLTPSMSPGQRRMIYVGILWLAAVLVWAFILSTTYEPVTP